MLEYCKTILEKMTFDRNLFRKELEKALVYLQEDEKGSLRDWCYQTLPTEFHCILKKIFKRELAMS